MLYDSLCGRISNNDFIANFLENLTVKKTKNRLRFDRVTAMSLMSPFFGDTDGKLAWAQETTYRWRCTLVPPGEYDGPNCAAPAMCAVATVTVATCDFGVIIREL